MINESSQEQNAPQQDPVTKTRRRRAMTYNLAAKNNPELASHNTDLAMSKLRDAKVTRISKANGNTQIQRARRDIEENLTQMLELHKQPKIGRHAILYLRVSTFPQAKFDIDPSTIVESTLVRQELTEQAIINQVKQEQNLSKREKRDIEESEEKQDGTKGSFRQQAKLCYKHAKEQGYYVTRVIVDIYTGYELHEREGINELRLLLKEGNAEVAVSLCLDRVSRNMAHTMILVNEFKEYGIRLDCVLEVIDMSRLGILMIAIQAFGNEDEREKIARRSKDGRQDKIERGELVGEGGPGYGYRWVKNKQGRSIAREFDHTVIVPDPDPDKELTVYKVVRSIGVAYMNGASMNAIVRDLSARGIPTAKGLSYWEITAIRRILQEPKYRGIATARKYKSIKKGGSRRHILNPDMYVYPEGNDLCPAYWTPEECEKIDAQLERNKRDNPRNNKIMRDYEFLLRFPFARCGHCGGAMACEFVHDRPSYICRGGSNRIDIITGKPCPGCRIYANILDPEIWKQVTPLLHNTGIMAELLTKLEKIELSEQALIDYDNTIDNARKALDRLISRRVSLDEGDEDNEEVIASIDRGIEDQKRILRKSKEKKAEILPAAQELERRRESIRKFLNWANKTSAALQENSSLVEKRDALFALGIRVYVFRTDSGCERWRMETNLENFRLQTSLSLQPKNSDWAGKDGRLASVPYLIAITPTHAFLNPELFAS